MEDEAQRTSYKRCYLPTVEIKKYNFMINEQKYFDQPVRNNLRTYDSIRKIATTQGDDYTTDCLMEYNYLKNCYKITAIDLSKQQVHDADEKSIEQINFTAYLQKNAVIFFIIKEAKEAILDFSQGTVKVFQFCFLL